MFRLLIASLLLGLLNVSILASPIADVSTANNRFAVALFHHLASPDSNLVFSPLCLHTALSMAFAGASKETAEQMAKVLEIEAMKDEVHDAQKQLANSLQITCNTDTMAKLNIANALWNAQCTAKTQFQALLREYYSAEVTPLPSNPSEGAQAINSWVDKNTEHRITQLVNAGDLETEIAFVLTNAVYFLGRWAYPFGERPSKPGLFTLLDGTRIEPVMMSQEFRAPLRYLETDEFQALELPYRQNSAAMVIFLPKDAGGLLALKASLSYDNLLSWLAAMQPTNGGRTDSFLVSVDVRMPKVETRTSIALKSSLSAMGMPMAFEPGAADFSNSCDSQANVWIGEVLHGTFLRIDERGTEAAAATMIALSVNLSRHRIKFICDHPFFFLIRDTATNTILFMGQIVDPRT